MKDNNFFIENFLITIPEGNFELKTQEEILEFVKEVQKFVWDDEENQGNPFAYNLFSNIGNDIEVQLSGRNRVDQILFRYKKQNFNPFFIFSIDLGNYNQYVVNYKANEENDNITFKQWTSHPNILSIRNKIELKKKLTSL